MTTKEKSIYRRGAPKRPLGQLQWDDLTPEEQAIRRVESAERRARVNMVPNMVAVVGTNKPFAYTEPPKRTGHLCSRCGEPILKGVVGVHTTCTDIRK
jgi:hypothetical protein